VIVIPLAGKSERFKAVGIDQPKWSLKVGSQSILDRAIVSVLSSCDEGEQIVLGCLTGQLETLSKALEAKTLEQVILVELEKPTKGQAESVLRIINKVNVDISERLVIWCGDSAFKSSAFNFRSQKGSWILVSALPGDHWSFDKEKNGKVIEVAEKLRISDHASLGLYSFGTAEDFLNTEPLEIRAGYTESFVAPLFNDLITKSKQVEMFAIDSRDYFPLGTPKEIIETAHRMKWALPEEFGRFNP